MLGAGLLAEANALAAKGWRVDALETPDSVARRPELYAEFNNLPGCRILTRPDQAERQYGVVTVTHVLEFIENPRERASLLRKIASRLAPEGRLLLSLRGWSDVRAARIQTPRGDGLVTGLGTWTRGFTVGEALDLIANTGLTVERSPHTVKSRSPEQVRLVCRKKT